MNVSQEHLMALLFAKNTGERFFADLFGNFSFFNKSEPLSQKNFTSNYDNLDEIVNYKKIVCLDNPYRMVYQEFLINSSENWKKKTKSIEYQQEEFTYWFDNIFYNDVDYLNNNCARHQVRFLFSKDFYKLDIDYVIKKESYIEDLSKIPFMDISKINQKLVFLVKDDFNHQKIITRDQAKKIFNFYRPYFDKFGFNPFSFTNEELTLKEKVNFIHN